MIVLQHICRNFQNCLKRPGLPRLTQLFQCFQYLLQIFATATIAFRSVMHISTPFYPLFFHSPDMNYFQKQPQTSLHLKIISGKLLKNMMPATVTCGGDITKFLNQFKKIKIPFRADNNGQWGQKPTYFMSKQNKSQPTLFLRVFSPFG